MTHPAPLPAAQLYGTCDPAGLGFKTTDELQDLGEMIGQARAMDALRFGAGVRHDGYNMFVLGPPGIGKRSMVLQYLGSKPRDGHEPADWCYIHNFTQQHKPLALKLPPGRGAQLRRQMEQLVDYLRGALPALFESEEYRAKAEAVQDEYNKQQEQLFKELSDDARKQSIVLMRTPSGFVFAPTRNNEVIPGDVYAKLPEKDKARYGKAMEDLQERLEKILAHFPQWIKERAERIKQLNRETTLSAVVLGMKEVRESFTDLPEVLRYLDEVQHDMVEHADDFLKQEESATVSGLKVVTRETFHRYQVNVLVTYDAGAGVPIVSEDNPTYTNLIGRVEHIATFGALVTDFTLIKPGALHQANGGYLLLDARKVLLQPFAWEGLKRALQSREIRIESPGQMYSLVSTVSLEPEPMPLEVKIVLFGDRLTYYLLQAYDPDFGELFKVGADFEEYIDRSDETHLLYARLVATLARRYGLMPFGRDAVARIIEHGARLAGDADRLSTHMRSVTDLLQEADHWAREAGHAQVVAADVQQAIDAGIRRQDRVRTQLHDAILRGTLMIDTSGAVTGQINGLSVIELGGFAFAAPTRITATTRLGEGEMVDIEREVKLSGKIHSKGVLIMGAFLAARYARNQPLAMSASLVFEQSYGMVDGDSASLAELCVLLSALAGLPVKQSLAVTGSVNQLGQVQAIGAVNEKIEGFFDICAARGLTGDQGVLIPAANVRHLMLRHDVVAAAAEGKFLIFAVSDVDEALALLTGMTAGQATADGRYPADSVNALVAARLAELADLRRQLADKGAGGEKGAAASKALDGSEPNKD